MFITFSDGEDGNTIYATWRIYVTGYDSSDQGKNDCLLELIDLQNAQFVLAQIRFCVLNGRDEIMYERTRMNQFHSDDEIKFSFDRDTVKKWAQQVLIPHRFDSGLLTLRVEVDIQVDDMTGQFATTSSDDLGRLLIDNDLSDVVLRVGDRKFPVHRAILAAKSPVFRAMFSSGMKESKEEDIPIEDMDPDVMEELLRCIYTDQISDDCGCEMLVAFDRFGLTNLFDRCQKSVTITAENAVDAFLIVNNLKATSLKRKMIHYLAKQ